MQKIIIPISKCIPGMRTAQPIVNLETGTTIIGQNQVLTSESIQNIENFIHSDIWVYVDSSEKVWNLAPEIVENYKKYTHLLMDLLGSKDTESEHSINIEDFETLCKELPVTFDANYALIGCTNLIEQLDHTTYTHSLNVAFICILICRWNGLDDTFTANALKAGLLHDIGVLNLSFDMANCNPYDLEGEQLVEYQKHSIFSYNIVSKIKDLDPSIAKGILGHHERCDGSGFPLHLTAPYINNIGKVLGLADTYERLHNKYHIFETLRILLTEQFTGFDTQYLLTFCTHIANYFIGSFVTLSTGDIGEVVFIYPQCVYRPIVRIRDKFINLYENRNIEIVSLQ